MPATEMKPEATHLGGPLLAPIISDLSVKAQAAEPSVKTSAAEADAAAPPIDVISDAVAEAPAIEPAEETRQSNAAADDPSSMELPVDAFIFVPGIRGTVPQAAGDIAARLASAFDRHAKSGPGTFKVGDASERTFGDKHAARCVTINRFDDDRLTGQIRVIELAILDAIDRDAEQRSVFGKMWRLTAATMHAFARFVATMGHMFTTRSRPLTFKQLLHIALAMAVFVALGLYALILFPALLSGLVEIATPLRDRVPAWVGVALIVVQSLAVAGTAIVLAIPLAIRTAIERSAVDVTRIIGYFTGHPDVPVANALVIALLEDFANTAEKYRRIHLVGYSFGGIVAMDSVFTRSYPPAQRLADLDSLVTIACPFDLFRAYWRRHFEAAERSCSNARFARLNGSIAGRGPAGWYNVLAPGDPISSNFRDDDRWRDPPTVGVGLATNSQNNVCMPTRNVIYQVGSLGTPLGWLGAFTWRGLRNHGSFWHTTAADAESCFDVLLPIMYQDDTLFQ